MPLLLLLLALLSALGYCEYCTSSFPEAALPPEDDAAASAVFSVSNSFGVVSSSDATYVHGICHSGVGRQRGHRVALCRKLCCSEFESGLS